MALGKWKKLLLMDDTTVFIYYCKYKLLACRQFVKGSVCCDSSLWYLPLWAVAISKFPSAVLCLDPGHWAQAGGEAGLVPEQGSALAHTAPVRKQQAGIKPEQSCKPTQVSGSKASAINVQPFSFMHTMPKQLSFLQIEKSFKQWDRFCSRDGKSSATWTAALGKEHFL